jgi:hypothetical protein
MERFAFSLSADSKAWLEDRADEFDISQADVMRRCVAQARRSGLDDTPSDTPADTYPQSDTLDDTDSESLRDRIDELEDRVEAIEDNQSSVRMADTYEDVYGTPASDTTMGERGDMTPSEATEDGPEADPQESEAQPTPTDHEADATASDADTVDPIRSRVMSQLGGGRAAHTNDAIVDTIGLIAKHEVATTGEIQDMLADRYDDHYSSGRSGFESIRDYVEQIDGVAKPGQGQYVYRPPE